jgi:hypothetical protein
MVGAAAHGVEADTPTPRVRAEAGDPVAGRLRRLGWDWPHLALVAFVVYGPIEKLVVPALGGYLNLVGPVTTWVPDAEAPLLGFVVFPYFFGYYLWSGPGIAAAFAALTGNAGFTRDERHPALVRRARADFGRPWWAIASFAFAALAVLAVHVVLWGPQAAVPPWFGATNTAHRALALVLIAAVAYVVAQIVVREVVAALWLSRLCAAMADDLVVHPYHADGAGGLGAIGQHAAQCVYLLATVAAFIGLGTLLPFLRGLGTLQVTFWNPLTAILWALFLVFVPLFFALLVWPPHRAMCRARDRRVNLVSIQLDRQLAAVEASIAGDRAALPPILAEVARLKEARALMEQDSPTWPFNQEIRQRIRLSVLLPVAQYVGTLLLTQLGRPAT